MLFKFINFISSDEISNNINISEESSLILPDTINSSNITENISQKSENSQVTPENPEKPGENPEKPVENPEKPGENPEKPVENSEKPGENPEKPGENPENPEKPGENLEKTPENSDKPMENSENPEKPVENPEKPVENPEKTPENPENPEKPGENPEKPVENSENPEKPGENPEKPGENPEKPVENPEKPGENPEKPGENPKEIAPVVKKEVVRFNKKGKRIIPKKTPMELLNEQIVKLPKVVLYEKNNNVSHMDNLGNLNTLLNVGVIGKMYGNFHNNIVDKKFSLIFNFINPFVEKLADNTYLIIVNKQHSGPLKVILGSFSYYINIAAILIISDDIIFITEKDNKLKQKPIHIISSLSTKGYVVRWNNMRINFNPINQSGTSIQKIISELFLTMNNLEAIIYNRTTKRFNFLAEFKIDDDKYKYLFVITDEELYTKGLLFYRKLLGEDIYKNNINLQNVHSLNANKDNAILIASSDTKKFNLLIKIKELENNRYINSDYIMNQFIILNDTPRVASSNYRSIALMELEKLTKLVSIYPINKYTLVDKTTDKIYLLNKKGSYPAIVFRPDKVIDEKSKDSKEKNNKKTPDPLDSKKKKSKKLKDIKNKDLENKDIKDEKLSPDQKDTDLNNKSSENNTKNNKKKKNNKKTPAKKKNSSKNNTKKKLEKTAETKAPEVSEEIPADHLELINSPENQIPDISHDILEQMADSAHHNEITKVVEEHPPIIEEHPVDPATPINPENSEQKPAENTEQKPVENSEQKPAENSEQKPAENSEQKPAENSEQKPVDNVEQKPLENTEQKPVENSAENLPPVNSTEVQQPVAQSSTENIKENPVKIKKKPVKKKAKEVEIVLLDPRPINPKMIPMAEYYKIKMTAIVEKLLLITPIWIGDYLFYLSYNNMPIIINIYSFEKFLNYRKSSLKTFNIEEFSLYFNLVFNNYDL